MFFFSSLLGWFFFYFHRRWGNSEYVNFTLNFFCHGRYAKHGRQWSCSLLASSKMFFDVSHRAPGVRIKQESCWEYARASLGGVPERLLNSFNPGAWRVMEGGAVDSLNTVWNASVHENSGVRRRVALTAGALLTRFTVLYCENEVFWCNICP